MSINLGVYDFFAYFIPGTLYLYVFNELLRIAGWKFIDFASWIQPENTPSVVVIIPILICAYIIGHILDPFAHFFCYRLIRRMRGLLPTDEEAVQTEKERYPILNIKFEAKDWPVLMNLLRQRNIETMHTIDKYQADSTMLRNVAFGSLLLAIIQTGGYFSSHEKMYLINSFVVFLLSVFSYLRSKEFRLWYFLGVYEASLEYGSSVEEVVEYNREIKNLNSKGRIAKKSESRKSKINK